MLHITEKNGKNGKKQCESNPDVDNMITHTESLSLASKENINSNNTQCNRTRSAKESLWNPIYNEDGRQYASSNKSTLLDVGDLKMLSQRIHLQEIEKQRLAQLKREETDRMEKVIEHDRIQQTIFLDRIEKNRQKLLIKNAAIDSMIQKETKQLDLEAQEFNDRQRRETQLKLKSMQDKFHDFNKRQEELCQKKAMFESVMACQVIFKKNVDNVLKLLQSLDEASYPSFNVDKSRTSQLIKSYDTIIKNINSDILTKSEVSAFQQVAKDMEELFNQMVDNIKKINDEVAAAEAVKAQKEKEQQAAVVTKDTVDTTTTVQPTKLDIPKELTDQLRAFVSPESLQMYEQIKLFYEQYHEQVKPLLDSEPMKKYRFNCQKAINVPVNAISAVSQQHLVDKYEKLAGLLFGNVVKIGDGQVSAAENPLGKGYCTLLLAKRFVGQADSMISGSLKAAFPIAAVLVALWQKFPDLGKLFLHYLYKECPYMVPYYLPQMENQTPEDYFKTLGYRFTNGVVETQDQYLKRISGISRLYAAILVTRPRCGEQSPHPHNLENGWRWLTSIINLDPLPDVCATLICEFLQVAGFQMWQVYGRQFAKLLLVIQSQYLPKLEKVDQGGPKARLVGLLVKIITEGKIDPVEGLLNPNFW